MMDFLSPPQEIAGLEWRLLVAVAFTAAAAYYDVFNRKWVPNAVAYGSLVAAVLLNIVFFSQEAFIFAVGWGALIFAATYLLYKSGQLGGADVYIISSLAMAVPVLQKPALAPPQQVPYPFILSVLLATGIIFIAHMLLRFVPFISKKISRGEVRFCWSRLATPAVLLAAFSVFIYALARLPIALPYSYLLVLAFLFFALLFFSFFKEEIKESMIETVPVGKLQEEDVLALDRMKPGIVRKLSLSPVLSQSSIKKLRKSRLKAVPVYTGMPFFLPYLLFGLIFTALFGDLVVLMLGSF
ncbi:MAG: hypothetical protein N3E51_00360 [Candidatus Micrarchaeota archaeon]|nr:hypothetical protein [Candidatus Micrarchaeota archaeon]